MAVTGHDGRTGSPGAGPVDGPPPPAEPAPAETAPAEIDPAGTRDGASGNVGRTVPGRTASSHTASGHPEPGHPEPTGLIPSTPTRLSGAWTAVIVAAVLLVALIVFIAENTQTSTVNFLGAHGRASTAVMLLIAAVTGALVVGVVGAGRIIQLRRRSARNPAGD